jgi:hypothetical protein
MPQLRFAAISDIHGNIWALEAVLADIGARGVTHIVNLGDLRWPIHFSYKFRRSF